MSEIRVNNIKNEAGSGAPTFPNGATIIGTLTGTATTAQGLTGTPNINVGFTTITGVGNTALVVNGNARITGILTIGTSSITLDGSNNQVNVGTGVTLHHTNGVQVGGNNLHSTVLTVNQINASGVVTATTFSGDLTGNATGLSGTPNITVGNATVTGDLTVQGTTTTIDTVNLVIEDKNIGIGTTTAASNTTADGGGITIFGGSDGDKTLTYNDTKKAFETNIAFAPNENRFITGSEKITRVDGNTVTLTYAGSSSNVAICTNPSGNITLNVVGIPTISSFDNHALTFSVIVQQTGTARTCVSVTLNGVSRTVKFAGGSLANALSGVTTTSGYTIQSFTGINTVGSASTTTNYEVFGIVSGGFF